METVEDVDLLRDFFYSDVAAGRRKIWDQVGHEKNEN